MRIRRASPLILLCTPLLALSNAASTPELQLEDREIDSQQQPNLAKRDGPVTEPVLDATATSTTAQTTSTHGYIGTEDAPVDGRDGKPHAGPFIDWALVGADSSTTITGNRATPTGLDKFTGEAIPEKNDGVMNDENRPQPKKGTTGTEGGISGKERARSDSGNRPTEPKEALPLPLSEIDDEMAQARKTADEEKSGSEASASKKDSTYGEGGHGMEKPADLPDAPYSSSQRKVANREGPPADSGDRSTWLVTSMPDTEGKTNLRPSNSKSQSSSPTPNDSASGSKKSHEDHETWHELFHSFVLSFAMIIFSEIGDKTFLVAALMAMRHSRVIVFSAALSALIAMTVLSAVLGHAFPALLPKRLTTLAAAILFFVFGAKSLREGLAMDKNAGMGEEMKEVEAELEEKEHDMAERAARRGSSAHDDAYGLESGRGSRMATGAPRINRPKSGGKDKKGSDGGFLGGMQNLFALVLSPAWVQTFIMTFLGEWGDRSQIATIAMAAGQDYWWVTLGAIGGHACCTGLAVIGGRALAGRVSMRVVTIGGAIAFLLFGVIYLYECIVE